MPIPPFRDNYAIGGQNAIVETFENEFLLSNWPHREDAPCIIDGASTDAGNTNNTGFLRKGLLMSLDRATNEWSPWEPYVPNTTTALNLNQSIDGILARNIDLTSNATDRYAPILRMGRVMADKLVIPGVAANGGQIGLAGSFLRYLVARQLPANILLDNLSYAVASNLAYVTSLDSNPALDVLDYPNGTHFVFGGAATAPFTLPAPLPGLQYTFSTLGDSDIVITSAGADQFYGGNATGNTLTLSDEGDSCTILGVHNAATTAVWVLVGNTPAATASSAGVITTV